jgi:hypothetical protein
LAICFGVDGDVLDGVASAAVANPRGGHGGGARARRRIVLTPTDGEPPSRAVEEPRFGEPRLRIELKGNLAAMLSAATNAKRSPETGDLSLQVEMVAGGSQPTLSAALAVG